MRGRRLWLLAAGGGVAAAPPVVTSTAIALADFQGYLHWLDKNTGELVARERVAKKQRVSSPPAGDGDIVVVLTDGGTLAAYRATPKISGAPRPAPASVVEPSSAQPAAPSTDTAEPAPPPAEAVPPPPQPPPPP